MAHPFLTVTLLTLSLAAGSFAQTPARDAVDVMLDVMKRRLLVMPQVAAAKWHAGQAIQDVKREREVLDAGVRQGQDAGLDPVLVRAVFAAQIRAGKLIQQDCFDRWKGGQKPPAGPELKALRQTIDGLNRELLAALGKARPWLGRKEIDLLVRERAAAVLRGEGITAAVRDAACRPLLTQ